MNKQGYDRAILISSLRGGGAERVAADLCNLWASEGQRIALLTNSDASDDSYALSEHVQRVVLNFESDSKGPLAGITQNIRRIFSLRKTLKHLQPQCLLGFNTTSNILAILASVGLDHKVVAAERNYPPKSVNNTLWNIIRRYSYKFSDAVVVQTEAGADWLRQHTLATNVVIIPNAVHLPLQIAHPIIEPDDILPANTKLIIGVGKIQKQKGFERLINAFSSSQAKSLGWQLAIIGAGDTSLLTLQAKDAGIIDNVLFIGRAGNIQRWYERADLFVLSSHFEGFPNVLLEAMATGCAVISVDCLSGPAEIISDGVNGRLVPPDDNALATAIDDMITDDEHRLQLANSAREITVKYSPQRIDQMWQETLGSDDQQPRHEGVK